MPKGRVQSGVDRLGPLTGPLNVGPSPALSVLRVETSTRETHLDLVLSAIQIIRHYRVSLNVLSIAANAASAALH